MICSGLILKFSDLTDIFFYLQKIMDIIVGVREGFEAEGGVGMVTIKVLVLSYITHDFRLVGFEILYSY